MEREERLKFRVGKPRVSFRETLRRAVRVEGECIRHTGTAMFARVTVQFEPAEDDAGNEAGVAVENRIPPETLPAEFIAAAEQGIRGALLSGELGYPVIRVRATMLAGQMNEELSSEVAFQAAGSDAVHKALRDNMVLLEPKMHVEVTIPEEYLGPVTGDLTARRAEILQILPRGKVRAVEALVPLRQMFDYSDKVRSLTQGRASWTMQPKSYADVPDEVVRSMLSGEFAF
jgi:elongation factor G